MAEPISLKKLEQDLPFFHKMYDAVRLVDPVRKRVLEYRNGAVGKTAEVCYDYWKNGHICDNCISVRAHHENKNYLKLEQNPDVIMLVSAIPIETLERPVVLELLKNATDSMLAGDGAYDKGQPIRDAINQINAMTVRDHLTSLYNRRFVDDRLPADIVRSTAARQPLAVIFIDIDNMKRINDTYGHICGDLALRSVADAIRKCIRPDADWAARYGGDEFFVYLNNAGDKEARRIAQKIRGGIAAIQIPLPEGSINLTASCGVKAATGPTLTAEEIIRRADEDMYTAKRGSRSRRK